MSHIAESCPLTKLNGGLSRLHSADEDAGFVADQLWLMKRIRKEDCKVRLVNLRIWPNAQHIWPKAFDENAAFLVNSKNTNTKSILWEGLQYWIHSELIAMK